MQGNTVKMLVGGSLIFMSIKIMDFKIKEIWAIVARIQYHSYEVQLFYGKHIQYLLFLLWVDESRWENSTLNPDEPF